jgi:predicted GIY-YIG superfamily endonuclease
MYYVYVLKSMKDGNNYVGYTNDLKSRLRNKNIRKSELRSNDIFIEKISNVVAKYL